MYARVTTIVFASSEPDAAETIFRQVLPAVEELPGFRELLMLSGLDDRSLVAVTLWETEEAMEAAQPVLEGVKRAETSFREVEATETARFYVAGSRPTPR